MRQFWTVKSALVLGLAASGCTSHRAENDRDDSDEMAVTLEQVPAAVKATLLTESAGGKIAEIDKVTDDGKTVYEADVMLDGKKWEVVVFADGRLSKKEIDAEKDGEDDDDDDDDNDGKDDKDGN